MPARLKFLLTLESKTRLNQNLKSADEKWEEVREYYERAYKVKFPHRISDQKVEYLYANMQKLFKSLGREYEMGRASVIRFIHPTSER